MSTSKAANRSPESVLIDFRHGTFRSPKASPPRHRDQKSSNAGTAVKTAENSLKKHMLSNKKFFDKQQQRESNTEQIRERNNGDLQKNLWEEQSSDVLLRQKTATYNSNWSASKPVLPQANDTYYGGASLQQQK